MLARHPRHIGTAFETLPHGIRDTRHGIRDTFGTASETHSARHPRHAMSCGQPSFSTPYQQVTGRSARMLIFSSNLPLIKKRATASETQMGVTQETTQSARATRSKEREGHQQQRRASPARKFLTKTRTDQTLRPAQLHEKHREKVVIPR